jgi:hypothetical protein
VDSARAFDVTIGERDDHEVVGMLMQQRGFLRRQFNGEHAHELILQQQSMVAVLRNSDRHRVPVWTNLVLLSMTKDREMHTQ